MIGIVTPLAEVFGHRKSTVLVPWVFVVPFHQAEVLAKPVCKLTNSLSDVHCLTPSSGDGIDDTGRSACAASFGVYNSFRVVDVDVDVRVVGVCDNGSCWSGRQKDEERR